MVPSLGQDRSSPILHCRRPVAARQRRRGCVGHTNRVRSSPRASTGVRCGRPPRTSGGRLRHPGRNKTTPGPCGPSPQSGGRTAVCVSPLCSLVNTYHDTSSCGLCFLPVYPPRCIFSRRENVYFRQQRAIRCWCDWGALPVGAKQHANRPAGPDACERVRDKPRGQPARRAIGRIGDDVIDERGVVGEKIMPAAPVASIYEVGARRPHTPRPRGCG
jgi:hypothetical protein